jgi:hypothetical protein
LLAPDLASLIRVLRGDSSEWVRPAIGAPATGAPKKILFFIGSCCSCWGRDPNPCYYDKNYTEALPFVTPNGCNNYPRKGGVKKISRKCCSSSIRTEGSERQTQLHRKQTSQSRPYLAMALWRCTLVLLYKRWVINRTPRPSGGSCYYIPDGVPPKGVVVTPTGLLLPEGGVASLSERGKCNDNFSPPLWGVVVITSLSFGERCYYGNFSLRPFSRIPKHFILYRFPGRTEIKKINFFGKTRRAPNYLRLDLSPSRCAGGEIVLNN